MSLKGKTVALGVTGGIAAYKSCEIVSALVKEGVDVHVVMTESAKEFVTPLTFETLSKNKVITCLFDENREWEVEHIALAKKADVFAVAPCSANVVGKLASGIADDFLTTTLMAFDKPKLIAPAMNTAMYNNAAFVANRKILESRGYKFIDAASGRLACGDYGAGKLADVSVIVDEIKNLLMPVRDLEGKKILVTLGATRTWIDPVRYITNCSSGKMGKFIIEEALSRGAEVYAVCGHVSVDLPEVERCKNVDTTEEMFAAVEEYFGEMDFAIMAAAPSDYVAVKNQTKIKSENFSLSLNKGIDIAATVGKNKGKVKLIVFAAETDNVLENAKLKLNKKNADMVVANDVSKSDIGFGADDNAVTLITADKMQSYPKMSKKDVARLILDAALRL